MIKKCLYPLALTMALATVIYTQTEKLMYEKLERPVGLTYYNMPVGLCEDYPEETTTMEIIRNDFEFLKKHNVKFMRISFGWDAIESIEGKYDWLFWDDFINMAVNEYGITLLPYICYTPQWISEGAKDTMFFWNYPPQNNKPWFDFVKSLVTRYKDKIKTWEVWNEPDIWIYWQGSREQFVDFMKTASDAVREADPTAKVVFPGIAYDPEFIKDLFKDKGMSKYFDIINMHNYYETWHRHPIEEITNYINEVHDVVWRYGNNQTLWMAEVGYSTFRKGARVSDSFSSYYNYEHSPEYQAIHLFKTLTLVASTEKISAVAWYEIKDLPPSEDVIGDNDNNRYLGVAYTDHKPKPSARALQFFNELFSKNYRNANDKIKVDRSVGSETVINAFENEDGTFIVTAWIQTTVPGKTGDDKTGMVIDNRKEAINIQLLSNLKGDVILYNELGNKIEFNSIEKNSDSILLREVMLNGGKIAIFEIK